MKPISDRTYNIIVAVVFIITLIGFINMIIFYKNEKKQYYDYEYRPK